MISEDQQGKASGINTQRKVICRRLSARAHVGRSLNSAALVFIIHWCMYTKKYLTAG